MAGHTARHPYTSRQTLQLLKGRPNAGESKAVGGRPMQTLGFRLLPHALLHYSLALFIANTFKDINQQTRRNGLIKVIGGENLCI